MKNLLCLVSCLATVAACKGDDGAGGARPGQNSEPAAPDTRGPDARGSDLATPEPFDHAAFCEQVFPIGQVERVLGRSEMLPQAANRPPMPGSSECSYALHEGRPLAIATAVFDCRAQHPRLETTIGRLLKVDKGRYYRDVDIAEGGAYARDQSNNNYQELAFVTAAPACAVYVSTAYVSDDRTEALAGVVVERLSADNAPRL